MRVLEFEYERSHRNMTNDVKVNLACVTDYELKAIGDSYINGSDISFNVLPRSPYVMDSSVWERSMVLQIKKVIFNGPATIVFWEDRTKTIIKRQPGDVFDPEKAIALCIAKKALGNKSNFNNVINKALAEARMNSDD